MRVCFVSFEYPPNIIGGAGTYAAHLVRGLDEKGIEVYTITRGDKARRDRKTYRVATPNTIYWRRFCFIRQAIGLFHELNSLYNFDLVHLNGTYPIIRGLKLPTVSTHHGFPNIMRAIIGLRLLKSSKSVLDIMDLVVKKPLGSIFDITTARASDKIICPNSDLVRYMTSYCFADKQKIHVIPNGVDLKAFDGIECFDASLLNHYNIQRENFLLYIGRLVSPKGVQYLIEAFKIVQKQHPNVKLVIAGRGNHEQQLRKIARNTNGVLFLGYVHSMRVKKLLYDASLSVVLPSAMHEVSPMVPLEGMASSKPVVASNVMGNSSMIKHGKNGFLTSPRDPESLAKFINVLCEDRALGKRMGMYGRKLVEKEFTLDKMINETLKTYECLRNEGITR